MDIGQKIKLLLQQRGVDRIVFAQKIGKTESNIFNIFNRKTIDTGLLQKISDVLEVPITYFFTDDNVNINEINNNTISNLDIVQGKHNQVGAASNDEEKKLLVAENNHLKKQIELLEEMIELLKNK